MPKNNTNNLKIAVVPILLLTAGVIAYKAIDLGSSVSKLSFDFKDVVYKGIKSFALNLDVRFNVVNPSKQNFTIEFISLDLILPNGKVVGQIRQPNYNKTIDGSNLTLLTIRSTTNLLSAGLDVANTIIDAFTGKTPDITIKGNMRANGYLLTINKVVKLSK